MTHIANEIYTDILDAINSYKNYSDPNLNHTLDLLSFDIFGILRKRSDNDLTEEEVNNLMSDSQKGDDLTEKESETGCTDKKCPFYLNPDYTRCKECEEKRKAGIMTPVEIARLVAGEYDKHDTEQDKVTQWIKDNADFIKEMARMLEENE